MKKEERYKSQSIVTKLSPSAQMAGTQITMSTPIANSQARPLLKNQNTKPTEEYLNSDVINLKLSGQVEQSPPPPKKHKKKSGNIFSSLMS